MPIRTLKPEFFDDEGLGTCSPLARLLATGLIAKVADDDGRFRAHPAALRAAIFPYDDYSCAEVEGWLRELAAVRFVRLYEVDGQRYAALRTWRKHQWLKHYRGSTLPAPPDEPTRAPRAPGPTHPPPSPRPAPTPVAPAPAGPLACRREDVVEAWNRIAAGSRGGPRPVATVTPRLAAALDAAIATSPRRDLAWWEGLFARVAASELLNGTKTGSPWTLKQCVTEDEIVAILSGERDILPTGRGTGGVAEQLHREAEELRAKKAAAAPPEPPPADPPPELGGGQVVEVEFRRAP